MVVSVGRPRTAAPEPEEAEALGKDLVLWITEETEELRTIWALWYAVKHGMILKHWKALKKLKEFRPYYEIAAAFMTQKLHNQVLEKGVTQRYLSLYHHELKDHEIEKLEKEAEIKKQAFEEGTTNLSDFKAWMDEKSRRS